MKIKRLDIPDFKKTRMSMQKVMENIPAWVGNAALNFYKDSWQRRGYITTRFDRWTKRSKSEPGRALLVKSGALRRSLRLTISGKAITISSDIKYAKTHNEGAAIKQTITAKQRKYFWYQYSLVKDDEDKSDEAEKWKRMALAKTITVKIPQRQFMDIPDGPVSPFLERRLIRIVEIAIENAVE